MKKKIISLTVLLLTVITGAWADVTPTLSTPLTIEVTSGGNILVTDPAGAGMTIHINGVNHDKYTRTTTIPVYAGDKLEFYGTNTSYYGTTITGDATCKVYGNIMSLVDEENFAKATTAITLADNAFLGLFKNNTSLTDASQLLLPATTLATSCYYQMFYGCTALTTAPALPATTLAVGCYADMFYGCINLTTAPVLPATTLNFDQCYHQMFKGCSSLNSVTCLATSITAKNCTDLWLDGVAAPGTFKTAYSNIWTKPSTNGIPEGWTTIQLLNENTSNSDWISNNNNGVNLNVTLTRTLKAGGWNTFSVPFGIGNTSAEEDHHFDGTPLQGAMVKQLTNASFDAGTKTLTLTFSNAESIEAGKPYLVKVGSDVVNPTFSGVKVINGTACSIVPGVIEFVPAINPTTLELNNERNLFVSGGDKLTWAKSGSSMKGFRAYFHILRDDIANALAFTMDFSDATGIANCELPNVNSGKADAWYDLQGRRVQQPAKKGIYVVNGKKYVIK